MCDLTNKDLDLKKCEGPSMYELFPTSGRDVKPSSSWPDLSLEHRHNDPSKCREPFTQLQIPQDSNTTMRTSNLKT
jgi:hypothetical protein